MGQKTIISIRFNLLQFCSTIYGCFRQEQRRGKALQFEKVMLTVSACVNCVLIFSRTKTLMLAFRKEVLTLQVQRNFLRLSLAKT